MVLCYTCLPVVLMQADWDHLSQMMFGSSRGYRGYQWAGNRRVTRRMLKHKHSGFNFKDNNDSHISPSLALAWIPVCFCFSFSRLLCCCHTKQQVQPISGINALENIRSKPWLDKNESLRENEWCVIKSNSTVYLTNITVINGSIPYIIITG